MTSNTLHCHICQVVLADNESTIKQHISSIHLNYRPYECINCKEKGDIFNTATIEAMDVHISTSHSATNSEEYRVIKDKMKETELNAAIEECRRLSTLKLPAADTAVASRLNPVPNGPADSADDARVPRDLKENLRQVYVLPGSTSHNSKNLTSTDLKPENTTTSRNAVQSENEIIQIDDDGEQTEVKQEHGQTSQDAALGDVRPKLEQNHNAPAIDQTLSEIIPNPTNESIDDNRTAENRNRNSESVSLAVKPEQEGCYLPYPLNSPWLHSMGLSVIPMFL
ncbi:hypothetical protein Ddc_11650 [Ditylenchus destructor]|nr:hypothetical protein Ddc_11650 [Ditylenchus destructor]